MIFLVYRITFRCVTSIFSLRFCSVSGLMSLIVVTNYNSQKREYQINYLIVFIYPFCYRLFLQQQVNDMSITQLEKEIQILTDQINDIFHATELNFDAIKIHLQIEDQKTTKVQQKTSPFLIKNTLVSQCEKEFSLLKNTYNERNNLRLEYLINQQIKSEEEKVRRQRLLQYEDKIYDHRRLICDKEAFYDSLLKPKFKRPANLTVQQFQDMRYKESQKEENDNFQQLEEQTQILLKLQKMFRNHRILLEEQFEKYQQLGQQLQIQQTRNQNNNCNKQQKCLQIKQTAQNPVQSKGKKTITKAQQKQHLKSLVGSKQTINCSVQVSKLGLLSKEDYEKSRKFLKVYLSVSSDLKQSQKQYKQDRQMYRYLKWDQKDLIKKYKRLQEQIKELKSVQRQHKRQRSV